MNILFIFLAESPVAMERLTPLHFINPHLVVRFSKCGGMLVSEALDPKENQKATVHQYPIKVRQKDDYPFSV